MRTKIYILLIAIIMLFSIVFAGCDKKDDSETQPTDVPENLDNEEPVELLVWGWSDTWKAQIEAYAEATGANVTVEYVPVDVIQYVQKVQSAYIAGTRLPDIICMEITSRGMLMSFDIMENLEAEPYNLDRNDLIDFVIPLSTNEAGEICGIENSPSPGALSYRKDLALKYLGTDDPKELQEMLSSWEDFIEAGKTVKENSNGEVFMFASVDDIAGIIEKQSSEPYLNQDGKLDLKPALTEAFTIAKQMLDAGIVDEVAGNSPEWFASFASGNYIFYPSAPWYPFTYLMPNDPEGAGNWGIMTPPGGSYNYGGTLYGIPKSAENKEAAWDFIQWACLSEEGSEWVRDNWASPSTYKPVYDIEGFYSKDDEYMGEDIGQVWADLINKVNVKPLTPYDGNIVYGQVVGWQALVGGSTVEESIELLEGIILETFPELS